MTDFFEENQEYPQVSLTAVKKSSSKNDEGHLTVDVYQTEDDIVVRSMIAGTRIEDIDIQVTQNMVTIKGNRRPEEPVHANNYYHRELYWGPFSRAIILPADIDSEGAKANFKNSVLTVRLPKLEKLRTKKLKIST